MKKDLDLKDLIYIVAAIGAFIISFFPKINESYRMALLLGAVILLVVIYFSEYFKEREELKTKMKILEERIEEIKDLINIKTDINILKNKVFKK